jgi:hypothetical protein
MQLCALLLELLVDWIRVVLIPVSHGNVMALGIRQLLMTTHTPERDAGCGGESLFF